MSLESLRAGRCSLPFRKESLRSQSGLALSLEERWPHVGAEGCCAIPRRSAVLRGLGSALSVRGRKR